MDISSFRKIASYLRAKVSTACLNLLALARKLEYMGGLAMLSVARHIFDPTVTVIEVLLDG